VNLFAYYTSVRGIYEANIDENYFEPGNLM
jgi:hypothetical protein